MNLVMPFLTDDHEFARGVEFGLLYERMSKSDETEIKDYFHTTNQDQICVAASRLGWRVEDMKTWEDGPEWTLFRLMKG